MARLSSLPLLGLAAICLLASLPEESTPHAQAQGFDHAGDPLPPGSTMRLGTTRLRQRGIEGIAFSPDSRYLVSYGWGDFIRFWNVETGQQARRIHNSGRTYAVVFSPDGTQLAAAESGGVSIWDLTTGTNSFEKALAGRVFSIAFSPDGTRLAAAGQDKTVRVWDALTGAELFQFQTEGGSEAQPVAFSPDGKLLASGSVNGTVRIWDLSGVEDPLVINQAHERQVVSVVFTRGGDGLYSSSFRSERIDAETRRWVSEIFLWKIPEASKSGELKLPDEERGAECPLALSQDGRILVSAHFERIVLWDTQSRKPIRFLRTETDTEGLGAARTYGLAISPDNRFVAAIGFDHKVNLWDVATGKHVFPQHGTHHDAVASVDASADGTLVVTGCDGGEVHLWDAVSGRHIRELIGHTNWTRPVPLRGSVQSVQFMRDDQRVLVACELRAPDAPGFGGIMKIVRVSNGAVEREWALPERPTCTAVSADGARVAVALGPGMTKAFPDEAEPPEIRVWSLENSRELPILKGHKQKVQQLQFADDGEGLWSTSEGGTIREWNIDTGEELQKLSVEGGESLWQTIAVSDDLQRAAYGNYVRAASTTVSFGQIAVLGLEGDENSWQKSLPAHLPIRSAFSPNNRVLAVSLHATVAGGANDRIVLVDVATGREVLSFELEDGVVRSIAFSRDGRTLYSGMDRGDILVWDISRAYD